MDFELAGRYGCDTKLKIVPLGLLLTTVKILLEKPWDFREVVWAMFLRYQNHRNQLNSMLPNGMY